MLLVLEGPNSFYPIAFYSKKLGHVAYSTPEGELSAMTVGLNKMGMPGLVMWEMLSGQVTG